ncbi:MAG: FecR domain-containing protein, partial [Usitatibacteraceae bacterium]
MNSKPFPATFRKISLVLAAAAATTLAVPAYAESGTFTYVTGIVTIERAGQSITATRGTQVQPGDVIVTAADGMAQLSMVDEAKLSLRSNSRMRVAQYAANKDDQRGALLNLIQGTLRSFTGLLTRERAAGYKMTTKVATIGIRGSGGILEVVDDDTTNHHTIECCFEIQDAGLKFPPVLTNANETVQVVLGQAPKLIPTPPSLLEAGMLTGGGKQKSGDKETDEATTGGLAATNNTGGQLLGSNGLGYSVVDAAGNVGVDPINLQSIVIAQSGSTISDQAVPSAMTLDSAGALRAYTAYAGSQSGTGANVVGGTASDLQTITVGANTTIVLGRWNAPTSFGFGAGNGGTGGAVGGSVHWGYGGAGFPAYLSDVLTGTVSYTRVAATTPTNQFGTLGTLTSALLDVNFTARTLNAVIGVTMPAGSGAAAGSWNLTASNVPFAFNTFFASGSRVTVTNASGANSGNNSRLGGTIEGSFVGNTLNGAILGYGIFDQSTASAADYQRINGVVAFSGPSQNSAAVYRDGLVSDPAASLAAASYIRSFATTNRQDEVTVSTTGAVSAFTAPFPSGNELVGHRSYAQGTSTVVDNGFDPTTGLVWGRWSGGSATIGGQSVALTDRSLHYIFSAAQSGPVSLPLTGTATYDVVGSTRPTDLAGHVGVFNSASLNANFSARTVDTSVNVTVNGQTWNGAATGVPIYRDQYFSAYAGGAIAAGLPRPAIFNITCTPNCTPAGVTGSLDGFFTGRRGNGAGVMYNMNNIAGAVA